MAKKSIKQFDEKSDVPVCEALGLCAAARDLPIDL